MDDKKTRANHRWTIERWYFTLARPRFITAKRVTAHSIATPLRVAVCMRAAGRML